MHERLKAVKHILKNFIDIQAVGVLGTSRKGCCKGCEILSLLHLKTRKEMKTRKVIRKAPGKEEVVEVSGTSLAYCEVD